MTFGSGSTRAPPDAEIFRPRVMAAAGEDTDDETAIVQEQPFLADHHVPPTSACLLVVEFERDLIAEESIVRQREVRRQIHAEVKEAKTKRGIEALAREHEKKCKQIRRSYKRRLEPARRNANDRIQKFRDELDRVRTSASEAVTAAPAAAYAALPAGFRASFEHPKVIVEDCLPPIFGDLDEEEEEDDDDDLAGRLAQLTQKVRDRESLLGDGIRAAKKEVMVFAKHLSEESRALARINAKKAAEDLPAFQKSEITERMETDPRGVLGVIAQIEEALVDILHD
jgi:hypothetical protein